MCVVRPRPYLFAFSSNLIYSCSQTIEPGCYFSPHLLAPVRNSQYINHEVLAKYEYVGGVRIEDVVVITKTGCEVLSPVGKEVEWLEAVASGSI
jgi:Xaa-Pro dipeptidase